MPKRLLPLAVLLLTFVLAACGDDGGDGNNTANDSGSGSDVTCSYPADQVPAVKKNDPPPATPAVSGDVTATVKSSLGTMTFTLDAEKAPCTVNSFVSLAKQNYFNATHCHRLTTLDTSGIAVLQCGDPTATGSGGPGYTFADETDGSEIYGPGVLAMANRGPDTNGSQFFIVYDDTPLDPDYTVFGHVDDATVKAISDLAAKGVRQTADGTTAPAEDVEIESVTIS